MFCNNYWLSAWNAKNASGMPKGVAMACNWHGWGELGRGLTCGVNPLLPEFFLS